MVLKMLDEIDVGATIARPVIVQGRTLLTAGVVLSDKHMQIFKAWGVTSVWIDGESQNVTVGNIDDQSSEWKLALEIVEKRFSKCIACDEIVSELKRIAFTKEYRLLKCAVNRN